MQRDKPLQGLLLDSLIILVTYALWTISEITLEGHQSFSARNYCLQMLLDAEALRPGECMTSASDNFREAAGNAVTAYAFSTLEQYVPLCLSQTVRVLAAGKGVVARAPLTMNGIEALDRSGCVLYRDLKGATSFDISFWGSELAAVSFERSASFITMMESEMLELEAYYEENRNDFSEQDFQLMFSTDGPRRKGDVGRYHMLLKQMGV
jgi:hypothetical protein